MKNTVFFIAILPNLEIQREVTEFKNYAAQHFNSAHALKSPPHITLISPFRWDFDRLKSLKDSLQQFAKAQSPFFLSLQNFDCFDQRVIFVDVEDSKELENLQKALSLDLEKNIALNIADNRPFHPHMTVAFKDLKKEVFPKAWAYFSKIEYFRFFEVNSLVLLRHNGGAWEVLERYIFGSF